MHKNGTHRDSSRFACCTSQRLVTVTVSCFLLLSAPFVTGLSQPHSSKPGSHSESAEPSLPTSPSAGVITPCVRICRYNADCYDGAVCIGCFRDGFEIGQWASMSPLERSYALQDAADRWQPGYEGSVSKEALVQQAQYWEEQADSERN